MSDIYKEDDMSLLEGNFYTMQNSSLLTDLPKPRPLTIKGQWTQQEDEALKVLVEKYGARSWALIATQLDGRMGKQCRERWFNHLRPDIKKEAWTVDEDITFVQAHKKFGNRWAEISKFLPGRSENSIKNHWNANLRKHLSKHRNLKVESSHEPSSVMQDYISLRMCMGMTARGKQVPNMETKVNYNYNISMTGQESERKESDERMKPYIPLPAMEATYVMQNNVGYDPNHAMYDSSMDLSVLLSGPSSTTVPFNLFGFGMENPNVGTGIPEFPSGFDSVNSEQYFMERVLATVNSADW